MNYSNTQKSLIKKIMLLITILGQASIALYLPALPDIGHSLAISQFEVKMTVTCFIIGFGISPMFFGPLSDSIGRKTVLLIALIFALVGFFINIFCTSLDLFIVCRIIEGIGCGGLLTSGRSIARDVFSGKELAKASSYLSMGFAIGFGLSPTIGGFLTSNFSWQAIFIFLVIFDLFIIVICSLFLVETKSRDNKAKVDQRNNKNLLQITLRDYIDAMSNKRFIINVFGGFFAYCVVIGYNVMTPFLIQNNFSFSAEEYGYLAILIGLPYYLGASINRRIVNQHGIYVSCLIGSLFVFISGAMMMLANWSGYQNIYVLIIPFMAATFGQALIFSNTIASALQLFPASSGGRMSALYSSLQMILVSMISILLAQFPDNDTIYLSAVVTIMGALSLIFIGFLNRPTQEISKII